MWAELGLRVRAWVKAKAGPGSVFVGAESLRAVLKV